MLVDSPAPPAATATHTCPNCHFEGSGNFCQQCGSRYHAHRITLGHVAHEVFHLFTHLDHGILYTLKELIVQPGQTQLRYVAGQRERYQKPFSLFFLCGTLAALGLFGLHHLMNRWHGYDELAEGTFVRHYFVLLQMALLPVYALVTWAFFRRTSYNYAEVAVLVLYNTSILFVMVILTNALRLLWPDLNVAYVEVPFVFAYSLAANLRFFHTVPRWQVVVNTLFISVTCYLLSNTSADVAEQLLAH
jgi:hypothetical protein